jgi:hypothetical protein
MMLSCERNPGPGTPPDMPPKPKTGIIAPQAGIQSAVYSYVGHPVSLYRPEMPIPVRHVAVRT